MNFSRQYSGVIGIALALSFLLLAFGSRADQPPMVFKHLSMEEGLSQATVNTIFQDTKGFIWIGTQNGLNRYDGNGITRYYRERNNAGGLASDFIWAIDEDKAGNLWLGTEGSGLVLWDRVTDTFKSYRHTPGDPASLSSDSIRHVLVDRAGRVWAATRSNGLDRLDPVTGEITHFVHEDSVPGSLSSNLGLQALLEDKDGLIWVGTSAGLDQYNESDNNFKHFLPPQAKGGVHSISSLAQDHRGNIWLGSHDAGLQRFDPVSGEFTRYTHSEDDPTSLRDNRVFVVFEDSAQRLWAGHHRGISLFDWQTGSFQTYAHDRTRASSLAGNTVRAIMEDRSGLLWIGTDSNGTSRWNSRSWALGHRIPTWLPEVSMINAFADADEGGLWLGTTVGLMRMGKDGLVTQVALDKAPGDRMVMSLLTDSKGQLWVGTMDSGLFLRRTDGSIRSFRAEADSQHGIATDGIMSLYEDSSERIWVGTYKGGVNVYELKTGEIRRYVDTTGQFPWLNRVRAATIREDEKGRMWAGTSGDGLLVIAPDQGLVHQFLHDPNQKGSLSSNTIYSLHVDTKGGIWVGTSGSGLDYLASVDADFQSLRFENVSIADGLSNDAIYGVLPDDSGQLWLPSNNGLMRFNPETRSVRVYHTSHGAQGEEYSFGASLKSDSGRLLFAGTHGYNDFDPLQLLDNTIPPPVVITRIEVQNKPLSSAVSVSMLDTLELQYHEKALSLEFAALDFTDPRRNQFAYRMIGFDDEWVPLRNEHRVSYTNLSQGTYQFQVKAAGADMVWNEEGAQLAITVRPAPWRTWSAYATYAILAMLLAAAIHRLQTQRLREQKKYSRLLAHEVKARTAELNQRNSELAHASAAKSSFLARMSHEIRTPMNGVIGMTELLSATELNPQQQSYTQTISRSAEALLQIINDILDLSKIEAEQVELEAKPFALKSVIEDCLALVAPQAKKKDLNLLSSVDPDIPGMLIGDRLRISQVLMNLLGNALKFTTEGEIVVRAQMKEHSAERVVLRMEVADTGIGIEDQTLDRVFDVFSQADETTTRRFGGTGLGLSICRQLVELMGGQIGVSSQLNVGSTFWCELPLSVSDEIPLPDTAAASKTAKADISNAKANNSMKRILVVEDNVVNQMVAKGTLSRLGYQVNMASDGEAAIATLTAEHFDLILMDCEMPGMDGFEATRCIRAEEQGVRHIPIIGLTAHASADAREACLKAGMDDFLSKPYNIDDLELVLVRWLAPSRVESPL